jgi:hypothetical protein
VTCETHRPLELMDPVGIDINTAFPSRSGQQAEADRIMKGVVKY